MVHPEVLWEPLTRPGRSFYLGRHGTVELFSDLRDSMGEFTVEFQELLERPDGQVLAHRLVVFGQQSRTFQTLLTIRDGLLAKLLTRSLE